MNGVADIHREEQSPFLKSKPRRTPLPKSQIVIVLLMQIVEPLCSQSIYPYVNELVGSLDIVGADKSKVGYYAGLIESLFYATEALTVFQWSRASDHVGRKPVLMLGMIGTMLSMLLFGLSSTLVTLILSRAFCGVLNGNIGVMKSALGELTDTTNRAEAFALMPAVWAFGATMGPLLGGLLARPADRFPVAFASNFWKKFPYFLPCAATAGYVFAVLLITGLFFEETVQCVKPLQGGKASSCSPSSSSSSYKLLAISPDGELDPDERPVSFRGLFTFAVIVSIANYAALGFLSISINALLPLFLHTPIELGGLNLDPTRIGYIMGLYGAGMGLFQMLFFANIVRRWGTRRVFILSMATFVPVFMLFPVVSLIAKRRSLSWGLWVVVGLILFLLFIMDTAFGCIFMYVTESAPNRRSLGATNGLAQTTVSSARAVGPALATSLVSFSVQTNFLNGYGVYAVLAIFSCGAVYLGTLLPHRVWGIQVGSEDVSEGEY